LKLKLYRSLTAMSLIFGMFCFAAASRERARARARKK